MSFADALQLQEEAVAKRRADSSLGDELLLLEHEPVYTIGRTPDKSSLLGRSIFLIRFFAINRGGQATYHGPGQLIGYPIVDLRRCGQDLHIICAGSSSCSSSFWDNSRSRRQRREGLTGVWVDNRKIASIGVGVRHWITMHGFALNVGGDLTPFDKIVPCGISNVTMTSMEKELSQPFHVLEVAHQFGKLAGGTNCRSARTSPAQLILEMIPLEDNADDIIGKAQRGLRISDSELAEKSGVSRETIDRHSGRRQFDEQTHRTYRAGVESRFESAGRSRGGQMETERQRTFRRTWRNSIPNTVT